MQFTQQFLEDLLEQGKVTNDEGETATLFIELFIDTIEEQEHWKLIFSFKENFYQVPYVICGDIRFNEDLADMPSEDLHPYIETLYEKVWNREELIDCTTLEDKWITLTRDEAEFLFSHPNPMLLGEKIQLTAPFNLYKDQVVQTFLYKGDTYGYSKEVVDKEGNITCRTLPYIPSLSFGFVGR